MQQLALVMLVKNAYILTDEDEDQSNVKSCSMISYNNVKLFLLIIHLVYCPFLSQKEVRVVTLLLF